MADLRIEQLPTALALVLGDLFPLAAVNEQIATGYEAKHITAAEVAAAILTTFEQAGLSTTSKTIVGALNEIVTALSNMSDVIGGTADPTSAQGNDYDLYVKYQVNGNAVSVVGFYVKLSGAWVTIATGSASVFLITLTESGSSWTADKTAAEIDAAYEAGEIMMCTSGSAPVRYFHLDSYITGTGFKQYIFEEVTRTAYWEFTISTHGGQTSIVLLTGSIPAINDSLTHVSTVWSSKKTHDEDVATLASARDLLYSMLPTDTASGAVASFPDGADNVPVVAAVANIDYDENGYTGMKIYETGANFLGGSKLLANAQAYLTGGTTDTENKTFTFAATSTPTTGRSFSDGCKFKENTPYTIILRFAKSNTNAMTNIRVYYTDETYTNLSLSGEIVANTKYTLVFTSNASKTIEFIRKVNASGTTTLYYDESGVFEGAKTLEDFVAYNGSTTVIDWTDEAGTIYGGDLDLNTGVLTSRYASDGSELVDPVEYDLEPVILSTYKGENCIWADAGNMTVNYRADIGLYIDKKTQSGNRSATLSASLTKSESEEKTEENETEGGNNER